MKHIPVAACLCALASCGYHEAGRADLLPKTISTVAVPAFSNPTTRYKITDWLAEAVSREFLASSRYRVTTADRADMILKGSVLSYSSNAVLFNPQTALATSVEIHLILQVSLVERATNKVLFTRPRLEIDDNYEIPGQDTQYFDESNSALQRVSQRLARQIVSDVLNNF
jgi:Lipopolysaccharide-assembly